MVRKHILYDFDSFKFVEVCFKAQAPSLWVNVHGHLEKNVCSVWWGCLHVPVRPCWLLVVGSSVSLLIFCSVVLWVAESKVLTSPTVSVDLSICPFKSVSFHFHVF